MSLRRKLMYHAARRLGRRPVTMDLPRAVVSFCFDDFPKSAAETGARILEDRGVRGSFYATADFAGRTIAGVRQYDPADIRRLSVAGHEIGCHTAGHVRLSRLSRIGIRDQIARNMRDLAAMGLTSPPRSFAYPFGDVNLRAKRAVAEHFSAGRGVWAGVNAGEVDRALLNCVCLEGHVLGVRPAESWLAEAIERRGWLIFLTHDVADEPTSYGVRPAFLEALVDRVLASGAEVLPIASAFDHAVQGNDRSTAGIPSLRAVA